MNQQAVVTIAKSYFYRVSSQAFSHIMHKSNLTGTILTGIHEYITYELTNRYDNDHNFFLYLYDGILPFKADLKGQTH